jgi:hypothetical protein
MSARNKLKHELKALGLAMTFFGIWIGILILLKTLLLETYHIDFVGWSKIIVGALILSKVVLILEHVSLGSWVRSRPAWVDTLLRTALYAVGVVAVLLLEHGLKNRHEAGGFMAAICSGLDESGTPHLVVNTICLSGALLVYNVLTVIRRHLGEGGLIKLFWLPPCDDSHAGRTP